MKVFIALPVYRELDVFFTQCLIRLVAEPPCEFKLRMNPGDSLVSRARNTLTADFLDTDCTDLLFIDSDLIFSAAHIERILSHDADVVGGFYPKKQEGPVAWVCNGLLEPEPVREDGLQRVRYMGTGFLRIRRRVLERMMEAYPELAFKPDHRERTEYDFWSVGVYRNKVRSPKSEVRSGVEKNGKGEMGNGKGGGDKVGDKGAGVGRYLSEDWFFCQRWLDLGGEVWGDTRIALKHVGQAIYPLRSQEGEIFGVPAAVDPQNTLSGAGGCIAPAPAPDHLPSGDDGLGEATLPDDGRLGDATLPTTLPFA